MEHEKGRFSKAAEKFQRVWDGAVPGVAGEHMRLVHYIYRDGENTGSDLLAEAKKKAIEYRRNMAIITGLPAGVLGAEMLGVIDTMPDYLKTFGYLAAGLSALVFGANVLLDLALIHRLEESRNR